MHTAINAQSSTRNFPCCARYVLHVSQIMLETLLMDLCTGSPRQRPYSQKPNSAPITQQASTRYKRAWPLRLPLKNVTSCNGGRLMSASPAKALAPKVISANNIASRISDLVFSIRWVKLPEPHKVANHFLAKTSSEIALEARVLTAIRPKTTSVSFLL